MGGGEARFIFWNDCSEQIWSGQIRKEKSEKEAIARAWQMEDEGLD